MSAFDELMSVPVGELIEAVGTGIAEAQYALDSKGIEIAKLMAGMQDGSKVAVGSRSYSMLELGLTPNFYQFVETIIEVKISISITKSRESKSSTSDTSKTTKTSGSGGGFSFFGIGASSSSKTTSVTASSVNASYSSKYGYSAEGSSLVRTKLVPVPAPALLNERIRMVLTEEKKNAAVGGLPPAGDKP